MYREHFEIEQLFNSVFSVYSLSLSLSLPCMQHEPKLSIKPVFHSQSFGLYSCFRTPLFTWYQSARVENLYNQHNLKKKPMKKNRWIEAWRARFQQRSSTEPTTRLGPTRCTSTCSSTATGVMSNELMTRHPNQHTETSRHGNNRRAGFCTASRCVWANNYSATFGMRRRRRVRGRT